LFESHSATIAISYLNRVTVLARPRDAAPDDRNNAVTNEWEFAAAIRWIFDLRLFFVGKPMPTF